MKSCLTCILLFAFSFLHFTDGAKFRCDYKYCKVTHAWYKYQAIPAPWPVARLMCMNEGGVLASPITPDIRSAMRKLIKAPIFTGIHATVDRAHYYTVDGVPLDKVPYTWAEADYNKVDYDKGGCLSMNAAGALANADCFKPLAYICYRDLIEEPTVCGVTDLAYQFYAETNKCYKFHKVPRNFSRAFFTCAAEGGHLAIINSDVEAKVIRDVFASTPPAKIIGDLYKDVALIGFYDWGEHYDWRTIEGQTLTEAGYAKFYPGEPNNSTSNGEYCGSVSRDGRLNDVECGKLYTFICEKSLDYPPVCHTDVQTENNIVKLQRRYESNSTSSNSQSKNDES